MNFFWVYDIPSWQFALICIGLFVLVANTGLLLLRKFIFKTVIPQAHNDVVSYFMAGMNAIYSITLGLIAVGAWETFNEVDQNVNDEASTIASLYQNIKFLPSPSGDTLKLQLKEYVRYTIEDAWPQQQQGIIPKGGTERLSRFHETLTHFEPQNTNQQVMLQGIYRSLDDIYRLRRFRLANVQAGLPEAIWYVIFFGALLNIVINWFFVTDKFRVHLVMNTLFAALLGSLVFLVIAMDYPFRGEFSVSSEVFEMVYEKMK